jgi:hypothetical protein
MSYGNIYNLCLKNKITKLCFFIVMVDLIQVEPSLLWIMLYHQISFFPFYKTSGYIFYGDEKCTKLGVC